MTIAAVAAEQTFQTQMGRERESMGKCLCKLRCSLRPCSIITAVAILHLRITITQPFRARFTETLL